MGCTEELYVQPFFVLKIMHKDTIMLLYLFIFYKISYKQ